MGIKSFFINRAVKGRLKAMNTDKGTTILGVVIGGVVAANIDYSKLLAGDHTEVSKGIGAVVIALFGWLTNKVGKRVSTGGE